MPILNNVSLGPQAIGTGDTVLIAEAAGTRVAIKAASIQETASNPVNIDFYSSPDGTSASGTLIGKVALASDGEDQPLFLVGRGFSDNENLIGKADVAGASISLTITQYTGGD